MKRTFVLLFILSSHLLFSQDSDFASVEKRIINLGEVNNEDFSTFKPLDSLLKDIDIVMLGEQSHGEGTAFDTKIKLVKYLHQNLGFEILAFESGFYDCKKASNLIAKGEPVNMALGKSLSYVWSTVKEFRPLVKYIEQNKNTTNELKILGFDSQFTGKISKKYFLADLESFLQDKDTSLVNTKDWKHLKNTLSLVFDSKYKALIKEQVSLDTIFINKMIARIAPYPNDDKANFWIQALESAKVFLSDLTFKTDFRDQQMAANLMWIKEQYPNKKIICWGATSHFLYHSNKIKMKSAIVRVLGGNYYKKHLMMGDYIKDKYKSKVFTVGFTAFQGRYGSIGHNKKIKVPKQHTLEYLLGKSKYDNFLVPLNNLDLTGYNSRPLGNFYMTNDISKVMDAVIFNRTMERPKFDNNLYLKIYSENKYLKPKKEEEQSEKRYKNR